MRRVILPFLFLLAAAPLHAQEPAQSPTYTLPPGEKPTAWLRYQNPTATVAAVAGTWNLWTTTFPMRVGKDQFGFDVRALGLKPGRYEYKFVANGSWEQGENRVLYINDDGVLERPPDAVFSAQIDARDEITIYLKQPPQDPRDVKVVLEPPVKLRDVRINPGARDLPLRGYLIGGGVIKFILDERVYGTNLPPDAVVALAGNFNDWNGGGGRDGVFQLRDENNDGRWELALPLQGLNKPRGAEHLLFRFVLHRAQWLQTPPNAPNAKRDKDGNLNLAIEPDVPGAPTITLLTEAPIDLSASYMAVIDGAADRRIRHTVSPGRIMETLTSTKELGAILDRERRTTTYRLFAPRASEVFLNLFDTHAYEVHKPAWRRLPPLERYAMWKDPSDGVWEITLLGLDTGRYYAFNVDGPVGDGEAFNGDNFIGDPYAYAAAHSMNCSIVMDRAATNQWFGGWEAGDWSMPRHEDLLIYEAHVRDLTVHPSSKVTPGLRGMYAGLPASLGTGTGLDHIRDLGFNAIELMPINEFENGERDYGWGYNTVNFFAPEASYARKPLQGSQYYEFKSMVDRIHQAGMAVILDVVFNHVGGPNLFAMIDKKYCFRLTPDFKFVNFSACGNDVKTEAPMMRRLIVDNILYWMTEHRVDGFRFDLAELIDMDTMIAIRDATRKVNPNVLLISEPWSLRAQNKEQLTGTGWAAWNNDFRYASKDFARGRADRDWLARTIFGSVENWTANPMQAVNYLESHDDMALVDELSLRPDRNGKYVQSQEVAMNKLAAGVLFTSLGIPMINCGQEFLRSKYGINNTYNKGDAVNAIRWSDREQPLAAETLQYYKDLVAMRQSEEGRSFRVPDRPENGYYQWLKPENRRALGYIVNAPRSRPGNGFVVLHNSDTEAVEFVFDLPPGTWRVIGDSKRIELAGRPGIEPLTGGRQVTLRVGGVRSIILMDGF